MKAFGHGIVMNYEQAIQDLQDNLVVIAEIERRQSAMLREHAEHLGEILEFRRRTEQNLTEAAEFRRRTDQNLAEITDKLNGLIGYIDGQRPPVA